MSTADAKRDLRNAAGVRLLALGPAEAAERSARIVAHLESAVLSGSARAIMLFLAIDPSARGAKVVEPDLRPLIAPAIASGRRVFAPRVEWKTVALVPVELASSRHPIEVRKWNVPEPVGPAADPAGIDLILTPGAAFDLAGGRLGRGAGYYDRYFSTLVQKGVAHTRIGVCFDMQIVERVPMEGHDAPMDALATESGLRRTVF